MLSRPASIIIVIKGIRVQASAKITPIIAREGLPNIPMGLEIIPMRRKKSFITPKEGLNICAHMKPETTMGTAQGNIERDLNRLANLFIRESEWARIRLTTRVNEVTPAQKMSVFLKLSQNILWLNTNS